MEGKTGIPDNERGPDKEIERAEVALGQATTDLREALDSVEDFDKQRDAINAWAKKWQTGIETTTKLVGIPGAASFFTYIVGSIASYDVVDPSLRAVAEQYADVIQGAMYGSFAAVAAVFIYAVGTIGGKIAKGVSLGKVKKDEEQSWMS